MYGYFFFHPFCFSDFEMAIFFSFKKVILCWHITMDETSAMSCILLIWGQMYVGVND